MQLGERVSLIPFKHKGKIGTIKYIGEIDGKNSGNWLGIELLEPTGDCSGEYGSNQIFQCQSGHGIFLRPTQVKSLSNPEGSVKMDQSSIMRMDESLMSGGDNVNNFFSSTISNGADMNQILGNFNLDHNSPEKQTEAEPKAQAQAAEGQGRVKGWKERLAKLREQKEQDKKVSEDTKIYSSTLSTSNDETLDKIKDIFAPAKGLERGRDGNIQIDQDKIVDKKEANFENTPDKTLAEELKKRKAELSEKLGEKQREENAQPQKLRDRESVKERSSAKDIEEKKTQAAGSESQEKKGLITQAEGRAAGGLRAPSKLKQTMSSAALTTEQRKQKLLEKQKAVNAKLEEKGKSSAEKTAGPTTTSRLSIVASGTKPVGSRASGAGVIGGDTARATASAKSKLLAAQSAGKDGEAKQLARPGSRLNLTGAAAGAISGRPRITKPDASKDGGEEEGKTPDSSTAKAGVSARRGSSREPTEMQFKRGRNPSASRDSEVLGLTMRSSSKGKDSQDLKFGSGKERTASKDKLKLDFGAKAGSGTSEQIKIDPDSIIIKKAEVQQLKDELEQKSEEIYNITIKMKKAENKCEVLIRDHQDALQNLESELMQKSQKAVEEQLLKHSEERNRLIQQANKSNDSKLNELQSEYNKLAEDQENLQEKHSQLIQEMKEINARGDPQEIIQMSEQKFAEMKDQLEKHIQELSQNLQQEVQKVEKLVEKVQINKIKIDTLEEQLQANRIDLEANQIEIEMLKDEKLELLAEMTENSKIEEDDILGSLGVDELKQQNRKLRQAVTSLAQGFEVERAKLQAQIGDEEGKKKIIASYEKKLLDMDVLLEELDRKEEELAELKIENEACLEYEQMVEEMAQEILKKEEENNDFEKKIRELEVILGIQEGYTENLEQYNQELVEEVAEYEAQFTQIQAQKGEDEELLLDLEEENNKYREKVQNLNKTIKELSEQIEQQSDGSNEKSKITSLVENINNLMKSKRENEIREIDSQLQKIDYHWRSLLKQKVIECIIPARLQDSVHFDSLQKIDILNQSMNRAMLMVRYICERQMPNVENMYTGDEEEELEKKSQFVRMMISMAEQAVMYMNAAQRILFCISNMSAEQYIKATTTLMAWQKVESVNEEMSHIIDKLKDENMSLKFDTSVLEGFIKQVSELHNKIERLFIEKTPEEAAQEDPNKVTDDKSKYQMTPAQLERQKTLASSAKLDVRHQSMRMCIAIISLQVIVGQVFVQNGAKNLNFIKKAALIYGRLIDIVFKLDHIDAEDTGKEYLNMQDLVIDKRFNEKFDAIKIIWSDGVDLISIQQKDWGSLLDAIQKDITQLFNDYKFKRLIKNIETNSDSKAILNLDQIFFIDRFKNEASPWMAIAKRIRTDLQNFEELKDQIEKLNVKNREQMKIVLQHERMINTMKVTNKSLEQRLTQAQTKIEELNSVKGENEVLNKKQIVQKKQIEASVKEIEGLKKYQEDMQKKLEQLQKQVSEGAVTVDQQSAGATHQDTLMGYRKSKGANQPSRQSKTSTFFQELAKTSWLGGRKADSSMTPANVSTNRTGIINASSAEVQKLLYQQEETYQNIIHHLQLDRMKLKGQKVTEKLSMMQKSDGALNKFIKRQSEKRSMQIDLSRDEHTILEKAIDNVDILRTKVKLQMASVKVVDLKKKQEDLLKVKNEDVASVFKRNKILNQKAPQNGGEMNLNDQSDCFKANININYMIIQARDQVNQAVKLLMSKDSKLTNLQIDKLSNKINKDICNEKAYRSTDEDTNSEEDGNQKIKEINYQNIQKVAEISVKGTENEHRDIRTKNVVFSIQKLKQLQNNIAVFNI